VTLYLTEGILNESVSGDEVIKAIDNRVGVLIRYSGENNEHTGVRYIEPYVYGSTTANNPAIRAYQYYGDTKTGTPAWKLLRLDRIESWQPTDNKFDIEPQARGWAAEAFNGNDKSLPNIYRVVELGEQPMTDLEKLRARTRRIQQGNTVNINDINGLNQSKETPVKNVEKKQTGPIGDNQPNTGVNNPETDNKTKQSSKPLNTNGTPKNNEAQPPVRQEPKSNGPIVGDTTNPEENNKDELMSNDQFRDMLKRNLELTDREKQKRGFDLRNKQ
jgi:hypothetical protein